MWRLVWRMQEVQWAAASTKWHKPLGATRQLLVASDLILSLCLGNSELAQDASINKLSQLRLYKLMLGVSVYCRLTD